MFEENEDRNRCSFCGSIPDGNYVDHITYYRCGHAYCEHCQRKFHKADVKWPSAWCEKCQKVVYTNYASTKDVLQSVELKRWEKGIAHDPRSVKIARALGEIDLHGFDDHFGWKFGGDGDNGESLMYELDVYFELLDRGLI